MKLNFFQWMPHGSAELELSVPLVFLHGMGGTGQMWRPITAALENDFRCIAFDQRGHGGSRPVVGRDPKGKASAFHATDYANDVLETLSALDVKEFLLVGHSMGVRTALATAHLAPGRVKGVIAVDIGISSEWGGGMGVPLSRFLQSLPSRFPNRAELKEYVIRECPDPSIAQYLIAVSKKADSVDEAWIFPFDHEALVSTIQEANEAPIENWVREISAHGIPMAFLRGMNSRVWLAKDYLLQKQKFNFPKLQFEEWENCGHGLPFEQRARFIAFIKAFYRKTIGPNLPE